MKIIVTGSRAWPDQAPVWHWLNAALEEHGPFTLVHGACATGADYYAHQWAMAHREIEEQRFPAAWEARGRAAGPERNARMIAAGADLVLAFPLPGGRGTQGTIKLAGQAGIPVKIWRNHA